MTRLDQEAKLPDDSLEPMFGRPTAAVALSLGIITGSGIPTQVPQFRAGVTVVPVEVRVVDKDGVPLRDLTKDDFTIRDDGQVQEIAHFQAVEIDGLSALSSRTFVIVLGRGPLNAPTKAIQGLVDFVRSSLLPGDRIAVAAYNRIIELTTDREPVARFLETYRDRHEKTDALLTRDNRGSYPRILKPDTRAAIDGMFQAVPNLRSLAGGAGRSSTTYSDTHYLKAALGYLRTIDANKHVIVVTSRVFPVGWAEDSVHSLRSYWFQQATSAKASFSFIHAAGVPSHGMYRGQLIVGRPSPARLDDLLKRSADQQVADQTGGTASFFQFAEKPLAALDRATRHYYLLGYYPTRDVPPEQYRNIEVSVRRPGANVLYRHAYQAKPAVDDPDDYRRAATAGRIADAAAWLINPDRGKSPVGVTWGVRVTVVAATRTLERGPLPVSVAFDPKAVDFRTDGDRFIAEVDVGVLVDDERHNVIGQGAQRLRISLTADELARAKREWIGTTITVNSTAKPEFVRAVVYQFEIDRTGSALLRLR